MDCFGVWEVAKGDADAHHLMASTKTTHSEAVCELKSKLLVVIKASSCSCVLTTLKLPI